jgi:hypothetical protein
MRMTDLKAGWAIVGNDGRRLGTVKSVGQNFILASRSGRPGTLYVPVSHVANVEHETVYINLAKSEAEAMGWEQPPRNPDAPESSATTDLHRHV